MDHLQTEACNLASTDLDKLSPLELVRLMNAEDGRVIPAVAACAEVIARAIEVIGDRLDHGGRLVYVGAGTSGRLGVLDATECPPTFSSPPGQVVGLIAGGPEALTRAVEGAEDRPELAEEDLKAINLAALDVLVGIASSGRTPYVHGAMTYARQVGAFTVGLSCNPDSDLLPLADLAITPVVGPEVLTGSTRLKAGTATKLVLNTLTTGAMVRLGKTYGNLMVDLKATNTKLKARTNRIVRTLTGLSADDANTLLSQCGGELKTALVSRLAGLSAEEARRRLADSRGRVRTALESTPMGRMARRDDLWLGVDGGGSSTTALLAARGPGPFGEQILGRGESGASNVRAVGEEQALRALNEAVTRAFAAAGMMRVPVRAACLGLAGAGREEEQAVIRDWAGRVGLAAHVEVLTDVALLLLAGTPDGWGVGVVAGTGSIAYGRALDGRTARAGGWGSLLGDEGSGYALAVAGLRAVARAADGRGPATTLMESLMRRLGVAEPQALIPRLYSGGWDRAALAALTPLVLDASERGDAVAAGLVADGARELAEAAVAVVRQLDLDPAAVPVAVSGGLLLERAGYREEFQKSLAALGVTPRPLTLVEEPARGAVRMALAATP